ICGILLYDPRTKFLISQLPFYGIADHLVHDYRIDVAPGTVMGQLWDEEDFWYSNQVSSYSLFYEANLDKVAEAMGLETTMFAVMTAGGQDTGLIQIANRVDGREYNDKDARLLQIFATQAASIIENARLYHEVQLRAEQADKLRQIAEMAGSVLSTEQPFKPVLHEIARFMNSSIVFINVVDSGTGTLITYPRWTYGIKLNEPVIQDMNASGFERSVAKSGGYYLSNNLSGETLPASYRNLSVRYSLNSLVMVPLVVGERIIGELGVANRIEPYKDDDRVALGTVAAQIASAMDRLLVYEATGENLDHRMRELDAIARISNELTLTVERDAVLDVIRQEAQAATYATGSTVALLHPMAMWEDAKTPRLAKRVGTEAVTDLMEIEREAVLRRIEPVLVSNYQDSALQITIPGIQSGVVAPIEFQDEVVGLLHVYHEQANAFNERVAGFLMTLAAKASLGYQNYVLYEQQLERGQRLRQRADQLKRIFDLGQMLQSSKDPEEIMEAIAYSIQQSVGFDAVLVSLFDDESVLHRVAQAGMPLRYSQETSDRKIDLKTLKQVFKDEYRINDSYFYPIQSFEDWYIPEINALSVAYEGNRTVESAGQDYWHDGDMLLTPIIGQGGNLLGMISLDRPHDNKRPDRQTMEVLETFSHQASTMLENIRLFMETQRSAEQEQRLSEMLESIARTLDMSEIAESVAHGLQGLLPFYRISLVLTGVNGDYNFEYLKATILEDGEIEVTDEIRTTLERTALGRSFDERKTYIYNVDDMAVHHYSDLQVWYGHGEESSYVTPLVAGGECLGILHIGSHDPMIMHQGDTRQLLDRMSQLVASTVQNARLYNQAVDLQILNRSVVESIQQGIVVLDNSGRILNINDFMVDAYGWDKDARGMDLFEYRPEISEFIKDDLRTVLEKGEPRVRFSQTTPDERTGEPIVRNLYLYPLRFGDQVRGAVMLVEDVTERIRLEEAMEARANQLAALTDVSTRITASLERQEVVNMAIDEMGWIIPYDVMTLWKRHGSYMILEGHSDFEKHGRLGERVPIGDSLQVQQLVETQKVVSDSSKKPIKIPFLPAEDDIHSWMGVPLVNQGHVVGMMIMAKVEVKFYDTLQERNIAFAFASQVAIAQANADLFEQTFERTNELGTLLEAAQATSTTRDVGEVFNIVAELMFSALEMETCSILVWDDVDDELEVNFAMNRMGDQGYPQPKGTLYRLADYPARQRVLRDREVIAIVDLKENADRPAIYPGELEELRQTEYGARLMVPLIVADKSIGILQLDHASREQGALTQQNVRMARALGAQVAIAVENAQLSQQTQDRYGELLAINTLSQAISATLHIDDMLPILKEEIPQLTSAEDLYLALYDVGTNMIRFPLTIHDGEVVDVSSRALGTDEVSYVIQRGHTLNLGSDYFSIDKLRQSMGISDGEGDIKSYMGVPLRSGDEVVGVLAVRSRKRLQAFNINDDRILTTIGSQIGAAIQNARLFERITNFATDLENLVAERTDELEEERDRLDTLYQITSELARTLDMKILLNQAMGMLTKAVGAQDGVILLMDSTTERLTPGAWLNPNHIYYADADTEKTLPMHPAEGLA
ncbi:MAG: GAF domain-containing protein, partial [Aggregatilineales bacterium]